MGNLVLATPRLSDAAILTAGNETAGLPDDNLQTDQPGEVWRTSDLTDLYLEIDFGAAQDVTLIALLFHNLTSSATWRVRGATTQANLTASPGYDSTPMAAWNANWPSDTDPVHALLHLSAAESYQFWRIDITDGGNPDGYIEAGRVILDDAWQLPAGKNIDYGWDMGIEDPSPVARGKGGQRYPEAHAATRVLRCRMSYLSEDEMYDDYYEIQRRRGGVQPVLAIRDPEAGKHLLRQSVYGLLRLPAPIANPKSGLFSSRLIVEEMR